MIAKIDFDDEYLDKALSRALMSWYCLGLEEKYARALLQEYVRRVRRKMERRHPMDRPA